MSGCSLWLAVALLAGQGPEPSKEGPSKATSPKTASSKAVVERLQAIHRQEGERWRMFLDDDRKTQAKLNDKPIYVWTNPTRSGGQHGAVWVWMHRGRPVVVGSIFSHPETGKRMVCHEFHSLAEGKLLPERGDDDQRWDPKVSVEMLRLPDAPAPEASAARRVIQMRSLSRTFTAHSIDHRKQRWELRLLPQPLYRYEKPEGDVQDGALFAFVTSAGTDPEVILVLEARKTATGSAWYYRAIRFSDSDLHVQRLGKEVWNSIRDDRNQLHFNPDHTYRLLRDKSIDELPELVEKTP
jgi:hypothetical protein